ncbi:hypothetical protein [Halobaculum lipolyticum]|uniref:Sensor histidine kinase n=1 Tax=Halobaculum lipolyticum TaxID=3032001 RepID=A0ABD5WAB7_9EURY|nr:hypothetical protein [Halobaculum sp. DT31]
MENQSEAPRRSRRSTFVHSLYLPGVNRRYPLYGIQILLGSALAVVEFVEGNVPMTAAWLVVAISGAVLFRIDPGGPLEV